ncbi:MAG: hypothetical protein SFU98_07965 [Leptospiraceae bacterium]|nr:hypothetical protein [Leptospiraceae bacterium]
MFLDLLLTIGKDFFGFLLPFLASVAFTLILRRIDGYRTLVDQIKRQKEEIKHTKIELDIVRTDADEMIATHQIKLGEQIHQFSQTMENERKKLDETIIYIYETSKERLKNETELLISQSVDKVNRLTFKVEEFENHFGEREAKLENKLTELREETTSSVRKLERYQNFIATQADDTARVVEDRLNEYTQRFHDRLEKIFDQANFSINSISKDMKSEVKLLKDEVIELEDRFLAKHNEFWKDVDSKKFKIQEDFSGFFAETEKGLDSKVGLLKNISESIADRAIKLDSELDEKKNDISNIVKNETEKFFAIIENFKQEIVGKREEILNETKEQITIVQSGIDTLAERYLDTEDRLEKRSEELKVQLSREFTRFSEELQEAKRKTEAGMQIEVSEIKERIDELGQTSIQKMKAVDEHFLDLKSALEESAREVLAEVEHRSGKISERTEKEVLKLDQRLAHYMKEWTNELEKLKASYYQKVDSLQAKLGEVQIEGKELLLEIRNEFETGKLELSQVFQGYSDSLGDRTGDVVFEIQNKIKKSLDEVEGSLGKVQKASMSIYEKQETFLTEYAEKLHKDLQNRLEKTRYEAEEVLNEIQKTGNNLLEKQEEKIDKFNSTLDERISRQLTILIDKGQLQLDALESRIAAYVGEVKENIDSSLKNAREDSNRQIDNFNSQVIKTFKETEAANQEFLDSSRKEFSRTKDEFVKVKTSIEIEINRVNELKNGLYNFLSEESSKLQSQRIRSEQLSDNIDSIAKTSEMLINRTEELKDKIKMLTSIDEKISYLQQIYSGFDAKVNSLDLVNDRINQLLKTMENSERYAGETTNKLQQIHSELASLKDKETSLEESIAQVEKKTTFLQNQNIDVKSIEAKFEKVEGLMMDLSAKHKQISALQNRIETLKEETEAMKNNLEDLLAETDERFEKLSDFLSVVDSVTTPQGVGNKKLTVKDQNLMKKKRATVLQLYDNFNWTPETIAQKLSMEKSLVEAIINNKKS